MSHYFKVWRELKQSPKKEGYQEEIDEEVDKESGEPDSLCPEKDQELSDDQNIQISTTEELVSI